MLHRRYARAVVRERRRQARVADIRRPRRNRHRVREIDTVEYDAGLGRRGTQVEIDARSCVQTDAGRLDRGLERALLEHGLGSGIAEVICRFHPSLQWFIVYVSTSRSLCSHP